LTQRAFTGCLLIKHLCLASVSTSIIATYPELKFLHFPILKLWGQMRVDLLNHLEGRMPDPSGNCQRADSRHHTLGYEKMTKGVWRNLFLYSRQPLRPWVTLLESLATTLRESGIDKNPVVGRRYALELARPFLPPF
jgi:hypothetical protein